MSKDIRSAFSKSKVKPANLSGKVSQSDPDIYTSLSQLTTPVVPPFKRTSSELSPPSPEMEITVVNKINEMINKKMAQWNDKLGRMKQDVVKASSDKMTEMQNSFSKCIEDKLENAKTDISQSYVSVLKDIKTLVGKLEKRLSQQDVEIVWLKSELKTEKSKRIAAEAHSRRINLRVLNIPEDTENLKFYIMTVLNKQDHLVREQDIDVIHRIGFQKKKTPRPVIIKFSSLHSRMTVWEKRMQISQNSGSDRLIVTEDFPSKWQDNRRMLWPVVKKARTLAKSDGSTYKASLQKGHMLLDGKIYTIDTVSDLPLELQPAQVYTPMSDEAVIFYSKNSPFSNHHRSFFTIDNVRYNCTEQYIMQQKCLQAGDLAAAAQVMEEDDPVHQKAIGKSISNFDKKAWEKEAKTLVKDGIRAKVTQNDYIRELLLATVNRRIAEANKFDKLFGIGFHLNDKRAWDVKNWTNGQNLMGQLLEEIRQEFQM